jgi:hypothetical protein
VSPDPKTAFYPLLDILSVELLGVLCGNFIPVNPVSTRASGATEKKLKKPHKTY